MNFCIPEASVFLLQQVSLTLIRGSEVEPVSQLVPFSVYLGLNTFGERGFCEICLETCLQMCQTQAQALWSPPPMLVGADWNGLYGLGDWRWSLKLEEKKMRPCGLGLPEFGFDVWRQTLANKNLLLLVLQTCLPWGSCGSCIPWIPLTIMVITSC